MYVWQVRVNMVRINVTYLPYLVDIGSLSTTMCYQGHVSAFIVTTFINIMLWSEDIKYTTTNTQNRQCLSFVMFSHWKCVLPSLSQCICFIILNHISAHFPSWTWHEDSLILTSGCALWCHHFSMTSQWYLSTVYVNKCLPKSYCEIHCHKFVPKQMTMMTTY